VFPALTSQQAFQRDRLPHTLIEPFISLESFEKGHSGARRSNLAQEQEVTTALPCRHKPSAARKCLPGYGQLSGDLARVFHEPQEIPAFSHGITLARGLPFVSASPPDVKRIGGERDR